MAYGPLPNVVAKMTPVARARNSRIKAAATAAAADASAADEQAAYAAEPLQQQPPPMEVEGVPAASGGGGTGTTAGGSGGGGAAAASGSGNSWASLEAAADARESREAGDALAAYYTARFENWLRMLDAAPGADVARAALAGSAWDLPADITMYRVWTLPESIPELEVPIPERGFWL